jgi:hypothetical protein
VQRTLTPEQKAQAAQAFDAEGEFLSAGKKLLDTKHPAFRAVTAIRTRISDYWKGLSLPFPEPGVRLIKLEPVEEFDRQMCDYRSELEDAVANLDRHFDELKRAAARRLGSLYSPSDYCPFCGEQVPYPDRTRDGSSALAECQDCDIYFDVQDQDVFPATPRAAVSPTPARRRYIPA